MAEVTDPFSSPSLPPAGEDPNDQTLLTIVAVANYVMGGMNLICGGCVALVGGSLFGMLGMAAEVNGGPDPEARIGFGLASGAFIVIGIIIALLGIPSILAGYGVQKRQQWGRILTIVLGVLAGLGAVLNLISLSPVGLLHGAYAVFVLVILLNSRYAAYFH